MAILITLSIAGFIFLRNKTGGLVSPRLSLETRKSATPLPSAQIKQPVEIKYDSSTDLKKELEKINPQVSDSDF